ncbi:TPA: hypothetical protein ACGEYS_002910 [Kluyvera cryocrescens]
MEPCYHCLVELVAPERLLAAVEQQVVKVGCLVMTVTIPQVHQCL